MLTRFPILRIYKVVTQATDHLRRLDSTGIFREKRAGAVPYSHGRVAGVWGDVRDVRDACAGAVALCDFGGCS